MKKTPCDDNKRNRTVFRDFCQNCFPKKNLVLLTSCLFILFINVTAWANNLDCAVPTEILVEGDQITVKTCIELVGKDTIVNETYVNQVRAQLDQIFHDTIYRCYRVTYDIQLEPIGLDQSQIDQGVLSYYRNLPTNAHRFFIYDATYSEEAARLVEYWHFYDDYVNLNRDDSTESQINYEQCGSYPRLEFDTDCIRQITEVTNGAIMASDNDGHMSPAVHFRSCASQRTRSSTGEIFNSTDTLVLVHELAHFMGFEDDTSPWCAAEDGLMCGRGDLGTEIRMTDLDLVLKEQELGCQWSGSIPDMIYRYRYTSYFDETPLTYELDRTATIGFSVTNNIEGTLYGSLYTYSGDAGSGLAGNVYFYAGDTNIRESHYSDIQGEDANGAPCFCTYEVSCSLTVAGPNTTDGFTGEIIDAATTSCGGSSQPEIYTISLTGSPVPLTGVDSNGETLFGDPSCQPMDSFCDPSCSAPYDQSEDLDAEYFSSTFPIVIPFVDINFAFNQAVPVPLYLCLGSGNTVVAEYEQSLDYPGDGGWADMSDPAFGQASYQLETGVLNIASSQPLGKLCEEE